MTASEARFAAQCAAFLLRPLCQSAPAGIHKNLKDAALGRSHRAKK